MNRASSRFLFLLTCCLSCGQCFAQDSARYISRYPGFLWEVGNAKPVPIELFRDTPSGLEVIPRSLGRRIKPILLDSVRFIPLERIDRISLHRRGGRFRAWLIGTSVGAGIGLLAGMAQVQQADGFTQIAAGGPILIADMGLGMVVGGVLALPFGGVKHRFPIHGSSRNYELLRPGLQYLRVRRK